MFCSIKRYSVFIVIVFAFIACMSSKDRKSIAKDTVKKENGKTVTTAKSSIDAPLAKGEHLNGKNVVKADLLKVKGEVISMPLKEEAKEAANEKKENDMPAVLADNTEKPDELKVSKGVKKIGCILPVSGSGALMGDKILKGVKLAFNLKEKWKTDFDIELVVKDSEGKVDLAVEALKELSKDKEVVAVIGPLFSKSAQGMAKILDDLEMPVLTPSAASKGVVGLSKYMFRNTMTNEQQGKRISEYAVTSLNLKKFAIFYPNNPYGIQFKDIFKDHISRLGGEVVAEEFYNSSANDFSSEIKRLGGKGDEDIKKIVFEVSEKKHKLDVNGLSYPLIELNDAEPLNEKNYKKPPLKLKYDAVFIPGDYEKVALIVPQLVFYNVTSAVFLGVDSWNSKELLKIGGEFLNGSYFVTGFFPDSLEKEVSLFVKDYIQAFGDEPDILSAQGYDAVNILVSAIADGHISREDIRDFLADKVHDYKGASGVTTILPSGESRKELYILNITDKKMVQVK